MNTFEVTYPNGRTFTYAELTENQKEFLDRYEPQNSLFTSIEEIKQVISEMSISEVRDVELLRAVRNSVVRYYSDAMESQSIDKNNKGRDYMTSMQSVTAVIDHCMYHINKMAV